jgi:F-type H+-transporting ATPase subunit gamma
MAGLKEIKRRLRSVRNTKKITYAMKLVSAAKLRKAQESVVRTREYSNAMNDLLAMLVRETKSLDLAHPLMETRAEVKTICLLVIGGGRGLCGGYNTNVNKMVESTIRSLTARHPQATIKSVIVGKKPAEYYRRVRRDYVEAHENLGEDANLWPVEEISRRIELEFAAGNYDEVHVIYTRFKSAISMIPTCEKLLPLEAAGLVGETSGSAAGNAIFEPSARDVYGAIIPRIVRMKVRQAALDAKASEQGSRMTAMDAATKNAGDLSYALQLKFNKVRQSRITSELLDILGGAEALD